MLGSVIWVHSAFVGSAKNVSSTRPPCVTLQDVDTSINSYTQLLHGVPMRILVADDDRDLSRLICTLLASARHQAVPAFDGATALMAAMRSPQPDLILLDVRMPAGDGQITLAKLKRAGKTAAIPVLVLSAVDDASVRAEMLACGAVDFMQKPFEPEALLAAISRFAPVAKPR